MALASRFVLPLALAASLWVDPALVLGPTAPAAGAGAGWGWPVVGPVIRGFDPPQTPFGAGHRGIDIAVAAGTPVVAPEAGSVSFAGRVGGELYVTLDHGSGLSSTYSWVSAVLVRRGDVVAGGSPIALSGRGHPGSAVAHLHLGVRRDGAYLDPLAFLGPVDVSSFIRLAPLAG